MNAKELGAQSVSAFMRMRDDTDTIGGALHGMKFDRCDGITKRELFAAMCLQGFAADPTLNNLSMSMDALAAQSAKAAVCWADALLAELAKDQP